MKIISGGGAGNEPAYAGFVGPGMLTASVLGSIYSSPPSHSILKLIEEIGTNHAPGIKNSTQKKNNAIAVILYLTNFL